MIDGTVGLLQKVGLLKRLSQVTAEHIKSAASKRTGLSDFGDPSFEPPMNKLMDVIPKSSLSRLGTLLTEQTLVKAMSNRLRVHDYIKRHPEVLDVKIDRPVFVLGFPRTGTTLLQNLLGLDGANRSLKFWELQTPVPLSTDLEVDARKRLAIARRTLQLAYLVAPEQKQIHEIKPDTAEECWPLFSNSFAVLNYDLTSMFTEYGRWLLTYDMTGPYRFYRQTLQLLAHQRKESRFILKCPEHLWFIDALLEVFPDARIVWTHRDPVASVASYCSMISLGQRMLHGHFDPLKTGQHIQSRFITGIQRAMEARARAEALGKGDQFFDVDFKTLVQDSPAMVRRIKEWADLPHDKASEARVQRWMTTERGDKRGAHKYSAEVYGLDGHAVHREYADYIERFKIPLKSLD